MGSRWLNINLFSPKIVEMSVSNETVLTKGYFGIIAGDNQDIEVYVPR